MKREARRGGAGRDAHRNTTARLFTLRLLTAKLGDWRSSRLIVEADISDDTTCRQAVDAIRVAQSLRRGFPLRIRTLASRSHGRRAAASSDRLRLLATVAAVRSGRGGGAGENGGIWAAGLMSDEAKKVSRRACEAAHLIDQVQEVYRLGFEATGAGQRHLDLRARETRGQRTLQPAALRAAPIQGHPMRRVTENHIGHGPADPDLGDSRPHAGRRDKRN